MLTRRQGQALVSVVALALAMLVLRVAPPIVPMSESRVEPQIPFILCGGVTGPHGAQLSHAADGRPLPQARIVSSEPLSHVPGKRVTVAVVHFPPGAASPPHRHGGSVTAYITKGVITSKLEGGPMGTFKPGDHFFEPLGIIHEHSGNTSTTETAELIAVFVHDEGATLTTYLQ
jgi:quercetin dioxygenase-like cupin family protein